MTTPTKTPREPTRVPARFALIREVVDFQAPLPGFDGPSLRESLVPGTEDTRYGKTWRMAQIRDLPDRPGFVLGRIGYVTPRLTTSWDEEAVDFVEASIREGTTFPFALDTTTGRLAYQARRDANVLSAFQALINKVSGGRWRVARLVERKTWEQWRRDVRRVSYFRAVLRRPNPNFIGRPNLEAFIEGSNAGVVEAILKADPKDLQGLDVESVYIKEAQAHHALGYGDYVARGEVEDGIEVTYSSKTPGVERVVEVEVADDAATSVALADAAASVEEDAPTEAIEDDGRDDD